MGEPPVTAPIAEWRGRFRDELDASRHVSLWASSVLDRLCCKTCFSHVERFGFRLSSGGQPNGGVIMIWNHEFLAAQATILRDVMNFSVVHVVEFPNRLRCEAVNG